jgi:hypothetical protein
MSAQYPDLTGHVVVVRPEETRRNLSLLRALAEPTGARWVWLTPHPVDERRIAEAPGLRHTGNRWHNSDLVAVADGTASARRPWWTSARCSYRTSAPDCSPPTGCTRRPRGSG